MIGQGTISLQYHNGTGWTAKDFKYTLLRTLPKKVSETGTDLSGTGYEHTLYKKNTYRVDIYLNSNATDYPEGFAAYKNHLYNFYAANRKQLSIDAGTAFEVICNETDIIPLEYIEFSESLTTITLTFEEKDRKDTAWS